MSRNIPVLEGILIILFTITLSGVFLTGSFILYTNWNILYPWLTGGQGESGVGGIPLITPTALMPAVQSPTSTVTLTATQTPTPTNTITPTITSTFTPEPTNTTAPSYTPQPTETPIPVNEGLPSSASIDGVTGQAQRYTLSCEARSAVDLAGFWRVWIDETEFLNGLPKSDDPNEGFVGNYWDMRGQLPPASYGVYEQPVAALLRDYSLNAEGWRGMSWDTLRAEIAAGRPVMAWVAGNTEPGVPVLYTPSNGNTTVVTSFEHTVLIVAYDETYVSILDGDILYLRTVGQFLDSWSVLENRAVTIR